MRGTFQSSLQKLTFLRWQVTSLVRNAEENIMFGVDDALFCSSLPIQAAAKALAKDNSLSCVHLRLSPGLTFCHPAGKQQKQPK